MLIKIQPTIEAALIADHHEMISRYLDGEVDFEITSIQRQDNSSSNHFIVTLDKIYPGDLVSQSNALLKIASALKHHYTVTQYCASPAYPWMQYVAPGTSSRNGNFSGSVTRTSSPDIAPMHCSELTF